MKNERNNCRILAQWSPCPTDSGLPGENVSGMKVTNHVFRKGKSPKEIKEKDLHTTDLSVP